MRRDRLEERNGYRYIQLHSGRRVTFYDARTEAEGALAGLQLWFGRMFNLVAPGHELHDFQLEDIERTADKVREWLNVMDAEVMVRRENMAKEVARRERIANLRNVEGRTPEEAALYLAKADALEATL